MALLNAAALVTGDGAVGLHVGELLLFTPEGRTFADRLRALGSITGVLKHIEPVIDHFETTSSAGAVEVASDHALVEVVPKRHQARHAHLCELTRGLLSQIPVLFDLGPALITRDRVRRPWRPALPLRPQLGVHRHGPADGDRPEPAAPSTAGPVHAVPAEPHAGAEAATGDHPRSWTRAPRTGRQPSSRSS